MKISRIRLCQKAAVVSVLSFLTLTTSCQKQEEPIPEPVQPSQVLRIGILPEQNIFKQKNRYQPLVDYVSQKIGVAIEIRVLSRYGNVITNFISMDLDGAFFGSFTGALAQKKLGVEPVARPEYPDGRSTYHGLVFTRSDSEIATGAQMRGKRFAFVDRATTAGWLLPLYYFRAQGIENPQSWLGEVYFAGTHEGAIYDVLEKKADIGAAKNTVFERLADEDPRIADELTILAKSPNVPENGLLIRPDLDAALKLKLRETLLNMNQDEEGQKVLREFGAARFVPTTAEDYIVVFQYADKVGLDLEHYDYRND